MLSYRGLWFAFGWAFASFDAGVAAAAETATCATLETATTAHDVANDGVLAVRRGPGANCSSIGSVIDLLFGAAVVSGVAWAAIVAAIGDREPPHEATKETRATPGPDHHEAAK